MEYLTTKQLSKRICYSEGYINQRLKNRVFLEGKHFIKPLGKTLFIWEAIEDELLNMAAEPALMVPMANGRSCYG